VTAKSRVLARTGTWIGVWRIALLGAGVIPWAMLLSGPGILRDTQAGWALVGGNALALAILMLTIRSSPPHARPPHWLFGVLFDTTFFATGAFLTWRLWLPDEVAFHGIGVFGSLFASLGLQSVGQLSAWRCQTALKTEEGRDVGEHPQRN